MGTGGSSGYGPLCPDNNTGTEQSYIIIATRHLSSNTLMDVNKLGKISVTSLVDICRRQMRMSRLDCQSRASIYSAISGQDTIVQESINTAVNNAIQSGLVKYLWLKAVAAHGKTSPPVE